MGSLFMRVCVCTIVGVLALWARAAGGQPGPYSAPAPGQAPGASAPAPAPATPPSPSLGYMPIRALAFHSTRPWLVSARGRSLAWWDLNTFQNTRLVLAHQGEVNSVAFSPDGRRLASTDGVAVKLWDPETGTELNVPSGPAQRLAFTADGRWLAGLSEGERTPYGSYSKRAILWEVSSGRAYELQTDSSFYVSALSVSGDGRRLAIDGPPATGGGERTIRLWDPTTMREVGTIPAPQIFGLSFSSDGRWLAGGVPGVGVPIWETESGRLLRTFSGLLPTSPIALDRGSRLAAGGYDKVKVWDAASGAELLTLPTNAPYALAFSPGDRLLATGNSDGVIKLWDPATGREVRSLEHSASPPPWKPPLPFPTPAAGMQEAIPAPAVFSAFSFTPRGELMTLAENEIRRRDSATRKELSRHSLAPAGRTLMRDEVTFSPRAFSADGRLLAGVYERSIHLWDAASGRLVKTITCDTAPVTVIAFAGDGRLLATGGVDQRVRMWDVSTGRELRELLGHPAPVGSIDVSGDGRRIVSVDAKGAIRL